MSYSQHSTAQHDQTPRLPRHPSHKTGLHPELLNQQMMGLSNDTVAVLEVGAQSTGNTVRFFDAAQGRPIGEPFTHSLEIKEIHLSQVCVCVWVWVGLGADGGGGERD